MSIADNSFIKLLKKYTIIDKDFINIFLKNLKLVKN